MKRIARGVAALLGIAALSYVGYVVYRRVEPKPPIRVGILHSRTGPMAISEGSMIDAEVLALEEVNARGGLLGRKVEWVIVDGKSDPPTFAREAERLITAEKVSVIFGCWTSASRKSVKPVVEEREHLLMYPMAYEGVEQSPNIVYVGAAPNQQIIPAVSWCLDVLKAKKIYVVGSDYVWPRTVNEIVRDVLKARGEQLAGESYIEFGSSAVEEAVAAIKKADPEVILSSVVGDTNVAFYRKLRAAGITPERTPVVSFSIAEPELRTLNAHELAGNYAAWCYFQSLDLPENVAFVKRLKARYGAERVASDVMEASYNAVQLWAQAVEEAGYDDVAIVRRHLIRQSLDAPEGVVSIDAENLHAWRPFYLGKIRSDGQFDVVWSITKPIRPVPYPQTRPKRDWENYVENLRVSWGGSWVNPHFGEPATNVNPDARAAPRRAP